MNLRNKLMKKFFCNTFFALLATIAIFAVNTVQASIAPLTVIATYTFKPDQLQKHNKIIENLIYKTQQEPGNISYSMYLNPFNPNQAIFIEQWKSAAAHNAHLASKHFKQAHKILDPLLAQKPDIQVFATGQSLPHHTQQQLDQQKSTVFQVATIGSLAQGVYDGDYDYKRLMQHGNFGLGTFLDLNGEMVAVDGTFYQIEADGSLKTVNPKQIVPFAQVTFFRPPFHTQISNITSYQALGKKILQTFTNKNIPYAIRIAGTFNALKLRSLRKQKKPYPPLTKAAAEQAIFNLQNVQGTIVGFWFPKYWAGIAVPGFHLHFVSADRTTGGHVLGISVKDSELCIEPLHNVHIYLPNTKSFANANLADEQLHQSIKQAEGGTQ